MFEAPAAAGGKPLPAREAVAAQVYDYMMERQRNAWLEPPDGGPPIPGITPEVCDAVLATRPRSPLDFDARVRALLTFLALPEAASLTAANKRIANLLKKSAGAETAAGQVDPMLIKSDVERDLYQSRAGRGAFGARPHRHRRLRAGAVANWRGCASRSMPSSTR